MKITTFKVKESDKVNPKKFVLWLIIIAIIMFFAGLTSAYLVRKAEGNWYNFKLPSQFIYSTITIILSSITLWWTKRFVKNNDFNYLNIGLFITLVLGILFCFFQYTGWKSMNMQNLYFTDDVNGDKISASFIYALTGLHVLHVMAGIIFLISVFLKSLSHKIDSLYSLPLELCSIYWHFIGFVWIYLFIFFNIT